MTSPDIDAAREDLQRTRAQLSDTLSQLSDRVTSPINTAKEKLNLIEVARNNPWPALAIAVGAGALLSATGSDARIATAAVSAGKAGAVNARDAAQFTAEHVVDAARAAPSKTSEAIAGVADSLAARGLLALIASLSRDERAT